MLLIEHLIEKGRIVESDRTKLPDGVLCRVVYPVCNIAQINANKRVYEAAVWEHVLKDPELKEKLEKRSLFGHAEHPQGSASDLQLTSHVIHEMKMDSDKVYQTLDVLDTPTGRIVDCLLRAECNVGVSTRAEGELEEAESKEFGKYQRIVPEKFVYITTDFTADPSTANMSPIEVRRNIVKAAEAVLLETKASKDDKQFGRAVIDAVACKSAKCDGSGCGACKALEKIKEEKQPNYREIADAVCAEVPFVDHKEAEQAAIDLVSDLSPLDEVNPEDVIFALVAHFKLFGKKKKDRMIKPESFSPENIKGKVAWESKKLTEALEQLGIEELEKTGQLKGALRKGKFDAALVDVIAVFGEPQEGPTKFYWAGLLDGKPFAIEGDIDQHAWVIWAKSNEVSKALVDYFELEMSAKKEISEPEIKMESIMLHKMKIQAKVSEAIHNAELQTALEAVNELDQAHARDAYSFRIGLKIANEAANKVMELQSQTIKAEQARDTANTILRESKKTQRIISKALAESQADFQKLRDQLEAITTSNVALQTKLEKQAKEHEAELQEISEHNIKEISAQGIKAYAKFKIRNSGLILTESTRALLDGCTSEEEVDKVYEQIVDVLREDALHQSVPKVIQIRENEQKKVDPNTTKVHKLIGSLMGGK